MALSTQDEISAKRWVADVAKRVAGQLNKKIEEGHDTFAFSIMIGVALFKDIVLDPAGDLIPIFGQIIGFFVSLLIFYFMWGKGYFNKQKGRLAWWVIGIFIDTAWLINLVPVTTLSVLMAWRTVRKRGIKAQEDLDKLHEKTLKELEEIEAGAESED